MSFTKESKAALKTRMMAAAILGMARQAYAKTSDALGLKAGAKARIRRSARYIRPCDFYNHGSKTFLKNKRKGF